MNKNELAYSGEGTNTDTDLLNKSFKNIQVFKKIPRDCSENKDCKIGR